MKTLGIVILAGFFGLLGLIFVVYIFKLCSRCREKLKLAAEFKKKDFEELTTAKPKTVDTAAVPLSVWVVPNANPNNRPIVISSDTDDSDISDSVCTMEEQRYARSNTNKYKYQSGQSQHDGMLRNNNSKDNHNHVDLRSFLPYGRFLKLPRIELTSGEFNTVKGRPEVIFQVYSADDIRRLQQEMWNVHRKSNSYSGVKDLGCNIIISVCTLEKSIGGIYLNLEKRFCQQYSYAIECLPWEEKWGESQKELEMKNMLFALLLWEEEIINAKTFRCYTGSETPSSYFSSESFYGNQVARFLEHLTECQHAVLIDSNVMVNRNESPKEFAQYIQPAEDLVLCRQEFTEKHIRKMYGIKEFVSSHIFQTSKEGPGKNNYAPSSYYNFLLDTVYKRCRKWNETFCPDCNFTLTKKQ